MARRKTTVGTHFKPSLGRYVPTYEREQEHADKKDVTSLEAPPKSALLELIEAKTGKTKPLTFPLDAYKPPKKSWWQRKQASWKGSVRVILDYRGGKKRWWWYPEIDRNGEGYIYADSVYFEGRWSKSLCSHRQKIGPDQSISNTTLLSHRDYSNLNMPGLEVSGDVQDVSWAGSNLRNARFAQSDSGHIRTMRNVIFDGANLEGGKFLNVEWAGVSLRGANVTDVDFSIKPARLGRYSSPDDDYDFVTDLTDSNVTEKQFDQILANIQVATNWVNLPAEPSELVRINRHTPKEVVELTGIDEEELTVLLWGGEIQYRRKDNDSKTEDNFDASAHYIPQWEVQRLLRENITPPTPA